MVGQLEVDAGRRSDAYDTDMPTDEPLRFADILTTASAVANYLGVADVTATHVLDAIAILREERTMEDLGRPVSPLVPRGGERGVEPRVRELVQHWWHELGEDVNATLDEAGVKALHGELAALAAADLPSSNDDAHPAATEGRDSS